MELTNARSVVPALDKMFAVHGISEVLKSGNSPPFQTFDLKKIIEHYGIKHRKITPFWPRANGLEIFLNFNPDSASVVGVKGRMVIAHSPSLIMCLILHQ